jgi:DinB superfamily
MRGRGDFSESLRRVTAQLSEMVAICQRGDAFVPRVSDWPVLRHFDHLTRAGRPVLKRLAEEPAGPPPAARRNLAGINLLGRLVLLVGWMPRGVGRAPAGTRPGEDLEPAAVVERLRQMQAFARAAAPRAEEFDATGALARHPVFGGLNAAQWARFLAVHQHHHLKIVRDILAGSRPS